MNTVYNFTVAQYVRNFIQTLSILRTCDRKISYGSGGVHHCMTEIFKAFRSVTKSPPLTHLLLDLRDTLVTPGAVVGFDYNEDNGYILCWRRLLWPVCRPCSWTTVKRFVFPLCPVQTEHCVWLSVVSCTISNILTYGWWIGIAAVSFFFMMCLTGNRTAMVWRKVKMENGRILIQAITQIDDVWTYWWKCTRPVSCEFCPFISSCCSI